MTHRKQRFSKRWGVFPPLLGLFGWGSGARGPAAGLNPLAANGHLWKHAGIIWNMALFVDDLPISVMIFHGKVWVSWSNKWLGDVEIRLTPLFLNNDFPLNQWPRRSKTLSFGASSCQSPCGRNTAISRESWRTFIVRWKIPTVLLRTFFYKYAKYD